MKKLIYIVAAILFMAPIIAKAEKPEPPFPYMKDGVIRVTLTDGQTYTFSLNDWKVVPRVQEAPAPTPAPAPQVVVREVTREERKNTLTLRGGYGRTGNLDVQTPAPGTVQVNPSSGFIFGLGYSRRLTEKYSLGGSLMNNGGTVDLGYHF